MIIYLLDSNACIRHLNGRAPRLTERLTSADPQQLVVCLVVKAELFFWLDAQSESGQIAASTR